MGVAAKLNLQDKANLRKWLLSFFDVDPNTPTFEIIIEMFFQELIKLDYTPMAMESDLREWKLFVKKYGNDLAALKRLEFHEIFSKKPFRLYHRKWFEAQQKSADDKTYQELEKMFKYVKLENQLIYYSWYELAKIPAGYQRWEEHNFKPLAALPEPKIELNEQLNQQAIELFDLKITNEKITKILISRDKEIELMKKQIKKQNEKIQELEIELDYYQNAVELEVEDGTI